MGQFSTRPPHRSAAGPRPGPLRGSTRAKAFSSPARRAASDARPLSCWRPRARGWRSPTSGRTRCRRRSRRSEARTLSPSRSTSPTRLRSPAPSPPPRRGSAGIDGLVNCAAIVVHADPLETSWADWERIFRVNLFGAYEASRLVAKSMIASGARGAIVSVASEAGKKGHMESLAYSASKAALINMTRVSSAALAPHDINVNCVCPGGVATDMLREVAVAYGRSSTRRPTRSFPSSSARSSCGTSNPSKSRARSPSF